MHYDTRRITPRLMLFSQGSLQVLGGPKYLQGLGGLLFALVGFDAVCIYLDRPRMKYLQKLRY
jgi:hypothetical protein